MKNLHYLPESNFLNGNLYLKQDMISVLSSSNKSFYFKYSI